jgi:RiboL-PSP-HEPN
MPEDIKPPNDTAQQGSLARAFSIRPEVEKRIKESISPYIVDFNEGLERANALIGAAGELTDPSLAQDLLRAVVVLSHAYLEDALRTLAGQLLPEAGEDALNDIPLAGLASAAHPQKFHLGKLAQHKGKTVDGVIRESIAQHLDRVTYNNTNQITQLLETLGFKVSDHDQDFPAIQQMMQRRHQIVHRGDRVKALDSDTYTPQPLEREKVVTWLGATVRFVHSLVQPLVFKVLKL